VTRPGALVGKAICTAPQKQVAVASSSLDHPSLAKPARGMKGLDLSAVLAAVTSAIAGCFCVSVVEVVYFK